MEWINLGYDLRSPISKDSSWKVGDLGIKEFSDLLGTAGSKIQEIISFDLNLSPRPKAIMSNRPGLVDLSCGAYSSDNEAYTECGDDNEKGILIFWQAEKEAYFKAKDEGWFGFLPDKPPCLPDGWLCVGLDVINDQGMSEYWDISEEFWELDQKLVDMANQYGLITDEESIAEYLPSLPLDPANKWVMPVRAWIASCRDSLDHIPSKSYAYLCHTQPSKGSKNNDL